MTLLWFIIGAVVGGALGVFMGWLISDRRSRTRQMWMQTEMAVAKERERDSTTQLQAQRDSFEEMRRDLSGVQQERASLDAQLVAEKQAVVQHREWLGKAESDIGGFRQQLSALQQDRSSLIAHLEAEKKAMAEQREQFSQAQARLREAFSELSVAALEKNSKQFFDLAEQSFKTLQTEAACSLDQKKAEMAQLLQPMAQVLVQYKEKLDLLEKARTDAYTGISQQLAAVAATQQNLSKETTQLVQALRKPQGRGRWGELTLKRLFEMAGMAQYVTFDEQVSVNTEDGRLRPDCIVNLPEDRQVIIDSKCVIDAFLDGAACSDDGQRLACMARHAQQVRSRVTELASKAYWEQFQKATDYVVLFLPGEAFLYAAVEQDPMLIETALNQRVIIASPTTLLGLLRVIEHAWRQKLIEANANEIRDLGATLYERVQKMAEHFAKLGSAIGRVNETYNRTVGSLEKNVLPAARKMSEMGVDRKNVPIAELDEINVTPRDLSSKTWKALPEEPLAAEPA
ncbi:MAG: DNA recombination protein RmuC [Burkholderiales bacterium]|nr:DNA recombination protein RmuC [Phycisphaerae bacterium]